MDYSSPNDAARDPQSGIIRWFVAALILSLLFHAVLLIWFRLSKLEQFEFTSEPQRLVPRSFEVKPAQFDPKAFEPEREVILNDRPAQQSLPQLSETVKERPNLEEETRLQPTPQTDRTLDQLVNEKPNVAEAKSDRLLNPGANQAVERELEAARKGLQEEVAPKVAASSKLPLPAGVGSPTGEGSASGANPPGFSDLDELLSRSGPLEGEVAPLNMPGGALFEYDSAELLPESIATLRKLGELVRRNPGATFTIEGHTDSFGSDEYNKQLSLARAEAVKAWLVEALQIDPARIRTFGFGSTKLLAPGTGTPEEQQINRRVEIVINTPQS